MKYFATYRVEVFADNDLHALQNALEIRQDLPQVKNVDTPQLIGLTSEDEFETKELVKDE